MTISVAGHVRPAQYFRRGDPRDPLGIWAARVVATGDATGGNTLITLYAPERHWRSFAFGLDAASFECTAAPGNPIFLWRAQWPPAGLTGTAAVVLFRLVTAAGITSTGFSPSTDHMEPGWNRVLNFWPGTGTGDLMLCQWHFPSNVNLATYTVHATGPFWARDAINAPGGPRFR